MPRALPLSATFLALAAVLLPQRSPAQTVSVGPDRLLPAAGRTAYAEPALAIDPDDPDRLAVVAIAGFTRRAGARGWRCESWQSHDGGASWTRLPVELPRCADPSATFDRRGRLHVAVLGGEGGVTLLRSDRGDRWDGRQRLRGSDHPVLARGPDGLLVVSTATARPGDELVSGLLVMASRDGGESFSIVAEAVPRDRRDNALAPAVTDDGTVIHGGVTFMESSGGGLRFLDHPELWTRRQEAGGLGPRVSLGRQCQTRVGFATLAGGPDRTYAVCVGAGARDILVYASDDGGRSWSEARGVLGGEDPVLDVRRRIQRRTPVLRRAVGAAVNRNGVLGVVWQDREADPRRACQRVLFSASLDGGRSFTPPAPVSSEPSCPDGPSTGEAGQQWPAGTDYGTLEVAADGTFVTAWADARDGAYRIRVARIQVAS